MKTTILFAAAAALSLGSPALAEPTGQLFGGGTTVKLSSELTDALASLGVGVKPIRPASLRGARASFPIPAGVIDLETLKGDVFHSGGLSLEAGGTRVDLLNFVIDAHAEPALTGVVSVNGDVVGRVPLFDLSLNAAPVRRYSLLFVHDVELTLTAAAAAALNDIFGVSAFVEGIPIGTASVFTAVIPRR
jgi:hypothetical protein